MDYNTEVINKILNIAALGQKGIKCLNYNSKVINKILNDETF